jgi:NADP-dependent 3-hydroxy acid dehydrogenase YdfG
MAGPTKRPEHPARRPAVVSGASSGIGAATAIALAAAGHPVALGARRLDRCEELAARIRDDGGEAVAHPLDVTDAASVAAFAKQVTGELGPVEVLVSNAGKVSPGVVHETDPERFAAELDLAVLGAHRLVRAFVPGMVERRRGDVVFVSSDVAVRVRPFVSAYATGKWGLEGMAQHADGARGHRRAGEHRPARADLERDRRRVGGRGRARVSSRPGSLRPRAAPALPQTRGARRRDRDGRRRAARRAPEPRSKSRRKHRWRKG